MVAIEAMSHGCPVVAAGHGGLIDIVVHEKTGLLVEPSNKHALADALHRLAVDRELRLEYGRAGQARQRSLFSVDKQVSEIVALSIRATHGH
jgi:glycosyltransferase involved in cell wall biosynthesis